MKIMIANVGGGTAKIELITRNPDGTFKEGDDSWLVANEIREFEVDQHTSVSVYNAAIVPSQR